MKKLYVITLLLMMFCCTNLASAMDWDNKEIFKNDIGKYGKYEIKNVFGYGEKLIDIELKRNTFTCYEDCYAIKDIDLYKKGSLIEGLTPALAAR